MLWGPGRQLIKANPLRILGPSVLASCSVVIVNERKGGLSGGGLYATNSIHLLNRGVE